MKTLKQLVKMYNIGNLDDVVKELRRYGTIVVDKSFDVDAGYHAGSHRICHVMYAGKAWKFAMHNGNVKSVGHSI